MTIKLLKQTKIKINIKLLCEADRSQYLLKTNCIVYCMASEDLECSAEVFIYLFI